MNTFETEKQIFKNLYYETFLVFFSLTMKKESCKPLLA